MDGARRRLSDARQPGAYALSADLAAVDETCVEITASDVQLDLAGHTMSCTGSGFAGSCQVPAFDTGKGIRIVPGLTYVEVKGPSVITGFDNGVEIESSDGQINGLTITGPACEPEGCSRPNSEGIIALGRVVDGVAQSGPVDVTLLGNSVSGYARGIGLLGAECRAGSSECVLNGNRIEGSTGAQTCSAINLFATVGYTVVRNVARGNGSPPASPAAGSYLGPGAPETPSSRTIPRTTTASESRSVRPRAGTQSSTTPPAATPWRTYVRSPGPRTPGSTTTAAPPRAERSRRRSAIRASKPGAGRRRLTPASRGLGASLPAARQSEALRKRTEVPALDEEQQQRLALS